MSQQIEKNEYPKASSKCCAFDLHRNPAEISENMNWQLLIDTPLDKKSFYLKFTHVGRSDE